MDKKCQDLNSFGRKTSGQSSNGSIALVMSKNESSVAHRREALVVAKFARKRAEREAAFKKMQAEVMLADVIDEEMLRLPVDANKRKQRNNDLTSGLNLLSTSLDTNW